MAIFGGPARIRLISLTIWAFEYMFFYPKLRKILLTLPGLKAHSVILDIGGNRGQSVKFFRKTFKRVKIYSFEPSPRIFKLLEGLNITNFLAFNFGISSKEGTGIFYECLLDEASTFDLPNLDSEWHKTKSRILGIDQDKMYKESKVAIKTIDTIVIENRVERIFLLKVDVEGHEFEVLSGARITLGQGIIDNIQIERHSNDLRVNDSLKIHSILQHHGFSKIASLKHSVGNFYEDIYTLRNRL